MVSSNQIELDITTDSTISGISLYSGEAEITRVLKFSVNNGLNKATIYGLSPSLRQDTLRVEGRGRASINDVTVSKTTDPSKINEPPPDPLQNKRHEVQKALKSATQSRKMLSNYLAAVSPGNVSADELDKMLDKFVGLTQKADARVREAEMQLADIDDEIAMRPAKTSAENPFGRWQVSVLLDADEDDEVQLVLKYVVRGADWTPSYDIRVDTQKTADNITIVYKALISQSTGENWHNTPLILETVTPSFGNPRTKLHTWSVSVYKPQPSAPVVIHSYASSARSRSRSRSPTQVYSQPTVIVQPPQHQQAPEPWYRPRNRSSSSDLSPIRRSRSPPRFLDAPAAIPKSDKGSLSATFRVAGLVDIPSDGIQHHVQISTMRFDTKIQWYSIPKLDTRVYLTAKIKNETDYTFVKGKANVFVDGSFVASSAVPPVNPQETFDCPLGSDPAVKVTYHPQEKRASQAGIVSRSHKQSYTQRITIQNTKSVSLKDLKILDNIPISQDERISVKLISPALPQPAVLQSLQGVRKSLKIASGILAQWDKADDQDVEDSAVGKDGKLNWLLRLPARQSVNVALQFEVSHPGGISLVGLNI